VFDSVDRRVLIEVMKEGGIEEELVEKVEEVLRETKSRVRIAWKVGKGFWMTRGVRQECPLSPMLFNLLIVDLEEEMRKIRWGGVRLGAERVYSLAYADDVVLLAEDQESMKSIMERMEIYLDKKNLELNVGKTKVVRFREGKGRMSKMDWWWRGKRK